MSKIFNKFKFFFRKPKMVIVTGDKADCVKEAIFRVLNQYFQTELHPPTTLPFFRTPEVLIFEANATELKNLQFFLKKTPLSVLVSTQGTMEIQDKKTGFKKLTFGFQDGVDFQATDIKLNGDTNFKINYKGSIVPAWLKGIADQNQIYSALTAAAVGTILGLNLVEVSQALKNYQSLSGKAVDKI